MTSIDRKAQRKNRAATWIIIHDNARAMAFRDFRHNRKSEPGAVSVLHLAAPEPFEDAFTICERHTRSKIRNTDAALSGD